MRVLVTGGAGFIGSHLVDYYLERGDEVTAVDNFITGSASNLTAARKNENFRFVEADVADEWERVAAAFAAGRAPDLILHFASPASPVDYSLRPIETMAVNSRGTENCLRAALKWRCRVLYASTSETYGDPLEHPQREEYWGNVNPVGPRSCYDESKRFGEALVMAYVRVHDVDARIIRIFNTYGPRMRSDDGRVVPNFVTQALAGVPLTVYGDGSQTRSFCYVDDLVEGISRCAAVEATRGVVVNLGNPNEYPIRVFADIVCRIAGVPLTVDPRPMPVDDPGRRCPDISRAVRLLGWQPLVTLEDGLSRTLRAFEEYASTS
jgi:nucleoside-diphosphate-sugar epimerase